jgi:MFS family permease
MVSAFDPTGSSCNRLSTSVRYSSPLIQLIVVSVVAHTALTGSRVTTSLYALSLHASAFSVGILIALFSLFPMIFAVPMGRLIDRIGIARPMTGGAILTGIGCALVSALDNLTVLYFAAVFIGTGSMAMQVASQHAVGAMSVTKTRSVNYSWFSLGYSASGFCGPVLAGFLIDQTRYSTVYAVFGGFSMLALLLLRCGGLVRIKLSNDRERKSGRTLDLVRDPEMRRIYVIGILIAAAWDLFNFVIPIHGSRQGFSASTIGLILGCFAIATFGVRLAMPWIARRYSEWAVLTAALSLAVVCYALFPFTDNAFSMMAVAAMLGLALGSSQPNLLALLHHASPAGRAAEAVGIRVTIINACQVILPITFGAIGATLGLFAVFWGMGVMIGTGVPLAWRKASAK